jgi:N-acetylglucosaminyl-diphospho-decaprenol L-rhamnosyltransferase
MMKLSVVIICWNDLKVILDCISSVFAETRAFDYEIIVTDNASTDGSVAEIAKRFPAVRIVENLENGGFGKGNNAGIRAACGEYVLILNPDTIIRDRAVEKLVAYADRHPEAGAVGCRILNVDGSVQLAAHPLPTIWTSLMNALALRWPGRYINWNGREERSVGLLAACCLLARTRLLIELGGFDERFFHQFEDADLCRRIWKTGGPVLFYPGAEITHIGGRSRGTYSIKVELETERSKYWYFYKYYGAKGAMLVRYISIVGLLIRCGACRLLNAFGWSKEVEDRLQKFEVILKWHWGFDPVAFIKTGDEPDVGYPPLGPGWKSVQKVSSGQEVVCDLGASRSGSNTQLLHTGSKAGVVIDSGKNC